MIKLTINNHLVTFRPTTKMPLKITNPIFNDTGAFSYPLSVSRDLNRALFEHLDSEDSFNQVSLTFELTFDDEKFMEGDIKVVEFGETDFQFYLKSGKSSVARVLKESYLDETINGQSWGDNPTGITGINASVNDIYPTNKFVVAPVLSDDTVINDWNTTTQELNSENLGDGEITPMVYLRHIVDRINQALTLQVDQNDFSLKEDFKRTCIFSPRQGNYAAEALTQFKEWLPHITADEFLDDLEKRFNVTAFFSPLLKSVEYLNFDNILNGDIIDWTNKFVADSSSNTFNKGYIKLSNSVYDDDDGLTPAEIEEQYDLTEVENYDDMTIDGGPYKITSANRYYKVTDEDLDNDLSNPNWVKGVGDANKLHLIENLDGTTGTYAMRNSAGVAGEDNFIVSTTFQYEEGYVKDAVYFDNLQFQSDVGYPLSLIVKAQLYNPETDTYIDFGEIELIAEITRVTASFEIPFAFSREFKRQVDDAGDYVTGTYLVITYWCRAINTDDRIWVYFFPDTTTTIDKPQNILKEIGVIGAYEFGDSDAEETEEVTPESAILYNTYDRAGEYLFQMPVSDITPDLEQSSYGYTIFRGKINDERDGSKYAPYCNFDSVDLTLEDYQSRVTGGATPDISLRWHGDIGLVQNNWLQRLIWFTNYRRPVKKTFKLTLHDIVNLKMYNRIRVGNVLYIIDKISVKIDVNGDLANADVELFTI